MNAFDFASTDGTLDVSPTVATLDVRGALSRLRRILSADLPPSVRFEDARAELDALEGVFVDALLRFDGMVDADNYEAEVQRAKDLEQERDDEETRREAAESGSKSTSRPTRIQSNTPWPSSSASNCCTTRRSPG